MPVGNQTALVTAVKVMCVATGIIPNPQTSNHDAFEILGRVAWALRDRGARLIRKSAAQNGYTIEHGPNAGVRVSHDSLAFSDGWVDCLAGAGPPLNENRPVWQWNDSSAPPAASVVEPWDLDADQTAPIEQPPPTTPPSPPVPDDESGLPTLWSTAAAPYLSLQWYTDMSASLEQIYRILLRRPADWGGAGNWVYHIIEGNRDPAWVIARFKESDEYKARRG